MSDYGDRPAPSIACNAVLPSSKHTRASYVHLPANRNVKLKVLAVSAAFGAFAASGPLQHVGLLPETMVGNASKALIKTALNLGTTEAFASCRGNRRGNKGFGNGGFGGAPGNPGRRDVTR